MPIRQVSGRSIPAWRHFYGELADSSLHCNGHPDAGKSVLRNSPALRIAEEDHHRIADIFVDRRSMIQSNARHLSQVLVEQHGQVFGFHPISGFGEADNIGEEDCQLLALAEDLDVLGAGKDCRLHLWRQIPRQFSRQRLEHRVFF